MKHSMLFALLFVTPALFAQEMPKAQEGSKPPELTFRVVQDFLKIPRDMIMAKAVGVAINSKGHIFILNCDNHPMLEFDQEGNFISSFGEGSPIDALACPDEKTLYLAQEFSYRQSSGTGCC